MNPQPLLVRGEVGESRLKSGVAGRGATPDDASTPARLTPTQDTEADARQQHHFLIRCKRHSERSCFGGRCTSPGATCGRRRPPLGQGEVRKSEPSAGTNPPPRYAQAARKLPLIAGSPF